MTSQMIETVEKAYRVFDRYRVRKRLAVCNCPVCMSRDDESRLASMPLRDIPASLLAEYTNSAHETPPGSIEADEFRHFLPRYFELMAAGEAPCGMGFDICLRRLERSEFRAAWQADEVAVIDEFFDAFIAQRMSDISLRVWPAHGDRPKTWGLKAETQDTLTCLVTAGCDLPRVLATWDRLPDPAAAIHMAEARSRLVWTAGRWVFPSAYLEADFEAEAVAIGAFLTRPGIVDRIEAAYLAVGEEGLEQILEKGIW